MGLTDSVSLSPHQLRYGIANDLTITTPTTSGHSRGEISDVLAHGHQDRSRHTVVSYSRMYSTADTWSARVSLTANDDVCSSLVDQTNPISRDRKRRRADSASDEKPPSKSTFQEAPVEFDVDDIVHTMPDGDPLDADLIDILGAHEASSAHNSSDSLILAMTASRAGFVDAFAAVNIVRSTHGAKKAIEYARSCGEDPSNTVAAMQRYLFQCTNKVNGCTFRGSKELNVLKSHELTCSFVEPAGKPIAKPAPTKQFSCAIEGCNKAYSGQRELDGHIRSAHEPVKCFSRACTDDRTFIGEKALLAHFVEDHPAKGRLHPNIPDQMKATVVCPIEGCIKSFRVCIGRDKFSPLNLLCHLKQDHNIIEKAKQDELVPAWSGNPCFFPGCKSEETYPQNEAGRKAYNTHLATDHDIWEESDQFEYSWVRVRGFALPMRSKAVVKAENTPKSTGRRNRRTVIEDSDDE